MFEALIARGAHPDFRNQDGKMPSEVLSKGWFSVGVELPLPSLKCLCAKVVSKEEMPIDASILPPKLIEFVRRH